MQDLKKRTVSGLTWSAVDNIAVNGIQFVVGIILARLLTPKEFGLIGMIIIFIAISRSITDSGFTQALVRKNNCKQVDYSTVFFFNIGVSFILYLILFLISGSVSNFFDEPKLELILKILGLTLIIDSFAIVQRARLTKRIDFKLQTKVTLVASISSGVIAIIAAYKGLGVWSLVIKLIIQQLMTSLFLWFWNKWRPSLEFSFRSFKEMFAFGYKLLISGLLNTLYKNIYLLIIGKFFSATELGYYTRADQFKRLPSENITTVIQRVTYPVLSTIQDDIPRLKNAYRQIIKSTMLISFFIMITLSAIARPLILTLIGEKWLPAVVYLQLLCFVGMSYPLHAINLNMLNVQGRSDIFLKLEIAKKILAVPVIVIGIMLGIKAMIIGMIFNSIVAFFLNSYYSGKLIGYSSFSQLKDVIPSFLFALIIGLIIFVTGELLKVSSGATLIIQIVLSALLFFSFNELFKMKDYIYLKKEFLIKFHSVIDAKR